MLPHFEMINMILGSLWGLKLIFNSILKFSEASTASWHPVKQEVMCYIHSYLKDGKFIILKPRSNIYVDAQKNTYTQTCIYEHKLNLPTPYRSVVVLIQGAMIVYVVLYPLFFSFVFLILFLF